MTTDTFPQEYSIDSPATRNGLQGFLYGLIQPSQKFSNDLQRRLRFLNILLWFEIVVTLLAVLLALAGPEPLRIVLTGLFFIIVGFGSVLLSRLGQLGAGVWLNGMGTLVMLSLFQITSPSSKPEVVFVDFHTTAMFMVLPVVVAGIVTGARNCIGLGVITVLVQSSVVFSFVRDPASLLKNDLVFTISAMRTPLAFISVSCLLALVFENNIFGLFETLTDRNRRLQTTAAELEVKQTYSARLIVELKKVLDDLRADFGTQLESADRQQTDVVEISASLEELGRVARRIDSLAGQASRMANDAVTVAREKAQIIANNAQIYGRLQQKMEQINTSVEELAVETRQIDQVVSSISEVAEETNLLALNASIESAGRREHGRRFSTVAAEVQRLAQRSREAAEEVRRVVEQVQTNVSQLAVKSIESRQEAQSLAESTNASSRTVYEIVGAVENSAQISQTIFNDIKSQQAAVIDILELVPDISIKSDEMRRFTRRLSQGVLDLEQALAEIEQDFQTSRRTPLRRVHNRDFDLDKDDEDGFNWAEFRRINWRRRLLRLTIPNRELNPGDRRRSRSLNLITLFLTAFLIVFLPISQFNGLFSVTFLPYLLLLSLIFLVYFLNRTGFYKLALSIFFACGFLVYLGVYELYSSNQVLTLFDAIKTTSGLLGLPILTAAIIANVRWIFGLTVIAVAETSLLAFQRVDRSPDRILLALVSPVMLLVVLGLLAAFLDANITRLTDSLNERNYRLASRNRDLNRKARLVTALSRQIYALAGDLAASSEHQTQLSVVQLRLIREITGSVTNLDWGAKHLVTSTQQIAQSALSAFNQAQKGAIGIEGGLHSIEEFQARVLQIANSSNDLQIQTSEIEQTFELINDVSEEVDLLALNATVEASQAREAGKRFAAVASEVQRLAGRARIASSKVSVIVGRIQSAVGLCVELTDAGQQEIRLLSETAHATSLSVQEIVQAVSNTSNLVSQIQDAVNQQSSAISQTLSRLKAVDTAGDGFRENIRSSGNSVVLLNNTAGRLSQYEAEEVEPELLGSGLTS